MGKIKVLVCKYLRETANKIDGGTSEVTPSEAAEILKIISHEPLSKEMACRYLNISRSKFDEMVRDNKLPKGRKRVGFKELIWWKDELDFLKNN